MMKKVLMILVLAALVVGGAFAQRVGDTVTVSGQSYTIQSINGNDILLRKVLTIDGTWVDGAGILFNISGATGVITQMNNPPALWQDAIRKGLVKVGDQGLRNLRKTGDLTWTGQRLAFNYNQSTPNVVNYSGWRDFTITMSADGRTISDDGGRSVWLTRR